MGIQFTSHLEHAANRYSATRTPDLPVLSHTYTTALDRKATSDDVRSLPLANRAQLAANQQPSLTRKTQTPAW